MKSNDIIEEYIERILYGMHPQERDEAFALFSRSIDESNVRRLITAIFSPNKMTHRRALRAVAALHPQRVRQPLTTMISTLVKQSELSVGERRGLIGLH